MSRRWVLQQSGEYAEATGPDGCRGGFRGVTTAPTQLFKIAGVNRASTAKRRIC
jgi:hypothetical protein